MFVFTGADVMITNTVKTVKVNTIVFSCNKHYQRHIICHAAIIQHLEKDFCLQTYTSQSKQQVIELLET